VDKRSWHLAVTTPDVKLLCISQVYDLENAQINPFYDDMISPAIGSKISQVQIHNSQARIPLMLASAYYTGDCQTFKRSITNFTQTQPQQNLPQTQPCQPSRAKTLSLAIFTSAILSYKCYLPPNPVPSKYDYPIGCLIFFSLLLTIYNLQIALTLFPAPSDRSKFCLHPELLNESLFHWISWRTLTYLILI
jgi:hypothetical protein